MRNKVNKLTLVILWIAICIVLFCARNLIKSIFTKDQTTNSTPSPTVIVEEGNDKDKEPKDEAADEGSASRVPPEKEEISLDELEPYVRSEWPIAHEYDDVQDTLGNTYLFCLRGYMSLADGEASETYYLNGEYQKLTGTVAVCKPWEYIGEDYKGTMLIYGDGKLLKKEQVTYSTKPYPISVDLQDVTDLQIELYGEGNEWNHGISIMLCEPTLKRTSVTL